MLQLDLHSLTHLQSPWVLSGSMFTPSSASHHPNSWANSWDFYSVECALSAFTQANVPLSVSTCPSPILPSWFSFGGFSRKRLPVPITCRVCVILSSNILLVSWCSRFRSLIHVELIFVYCDRWGCYFLPLQPDTQCPHSISWDIPPPFFFFGVCSVLLKIRCICVLSPLGFLFCCMVLFLFLYKAVFMTTAL